MENPEVDIYKYLKRNSLITNSAVIVAAIAIVASIFLSARYNYLTSRLLIDNLVAIDNQGHILPTKLEKRFQKIPVEVQDFVGSLAERYYSYSYTNVKKKPRTAQWFFSKPDFDKLQSKYKPWYKEVENKKLTQKAILETPDSMQINTTQEPYTFTASMKIVIGNGYNDKTFRLRTSGQIVLVDADYPKNPHGFQILNYKEEPLELIIQ